MRITRAYEVNANIRNGWKAGIPSRSVESMVSILHGRLGAALVAALLLLQLCVAWLSLTTYEQISVFCTGPASSNLGWLFGGLHLLLLGLLVLGLLALRAVQLRALYIVVLTAALALLPIQATLVQRSVISCDSP
jgi:hypothetical protein